MPATTYHIAALKHPNQSSHVSFSACRAEWMLDQWIDSESSGENGDAPSTLIARGTVEIHYNGARDAVAYALLALGASEEPRFIATLSRQELLRQRDEALASGEADVIYTGQFLTHPARSTDALRPARNPCE